MACRLRCLDAHCGRQLRTHFAPSVEMLLSESWRNFFFALSLYISCTVADVEFMHARNRVRATRSANCSMSWANFVADFINEESQSIFGLQKAEARLASHSVLQGAADPPEAGLEWSVASPPGAVAQLPQVAAQSPLPEKNIRAWLAIDFFRSSLIRESKASGLKVNWVTAEAWVQVKERFEALGDDERSKYEAMAGSSKGAARQHRRDRKAVVAQAALVAGAIGAARSAKGLSGRTSLILWVLPLGPAHNYINAALTFRVVGLPSGVAFARS